MLIRLYASNNDAVAAVDLVNAESDATVTPHMLASAISACTGGSTGGSGSGDSSHGHTNRDGSKVGASTSTSATGSATDSRYNNRLSSSTASSSSSSSSSSMSWKEALVLLQRGIRLSKADEAVFTAAAQCCARQGQYTYAFRIMGDTRDYHPLIIHPNNTQYQHTLSTHPINTLYQHPTNPPSSLTLHLPSLSTRRHASSRP